MAWSGSTSRGPRERLTWLGGASNRSESHARDITLRRRSEQVTVLPTELRRAFVPHAPGGAARVQVLVQHQLPCFLQTQLLLVLHRAHAVTARKCCRKVEGSCARDPPSVRPLEAGPP